MFSNSGGKQVLETKKASLEEAPQEHLKKLQDCKERPGMGEGCDDKAHSYEHTLPAARTHLTEIVDLLGGEETIKHIQGWGRPRLTQFFAFLSNTGYGQNVHFYVRGQETRDSLCGRSTVNGFHETMAYRLAKSLSKDRNVVFGWALEIQNKMVREKEYTLRVQQAAQKKKADEALQVQTNELYALRELRFIHGFSIGCTSVGQHREC